MFRPSTTYAKRHRLRTSPDADLNVIDEDSDDHEEVPGPSELGVRKRTNFKGKSRKKRKLSDPTAPQNVDMSTTNLNPALHPFQTPFPTLQAQSQVYKLPSTKPLPTPGVLSPVPIVKGVPTNSKNLKENRNHSRKSAADRSWYTRTKTKDGAGTSSKSLSSKPPTTRSINSRNSSRNSSRSRSGAEKGREDGSKSRSSSASNSSYHSHSHSQAQQKSKSQHNHNHNHNANSTTKYLPRLKHAQSLSSLNINTDADAYTDLDAEAYAVPHPHPKAKAKSKSKKKAAHKSKHTGLPLASPFESRASSPVRAGAGYADENAHISSYSTNDDGVRGMMGPPPIPDQSLARNTKRQRTALGDTFFDANLPHENDPPQAQSQSTHTSPQNSDGAKVKTNTKTRDKLTASLKIDLGLASQARRKSQKQKPKRTSLLLHEPQNQYERERRPSAPSSFRPPRPQRQINVGVRSRDGGQNVDADADAGVAPLALTLALEPETEDPTQTKRRKLRLGSGLDIVLGPPMSASAADEGRPAPKPKTKPKPKSKPDAHPDRDPEAAMEWMHSRGAVDFNRPPSQMSVAGGFGFGSGNGFGGWVDGAEVFLTSSSEGEGEGEDDEEDGDKHQNKNKPAQTRARLRRMSSLDLDLLGPLFDFDPNGYPDLEAFGEDVRAASTPVHLKTGAGAGVKAKAKMKKKATAGQAQALEVLTGSSSAGGLTRTHSLPDVKKHRGGQQGLALLSSSSAVKHQDKEKKKREEGGSSLMRTHSLPPPDRLAVLSSSSSLGVGRDGRAGYEDEDEDEEDEDGEADMELTGSAGGGGGIGVRKLSAGGTGRVGLDAEVEASAEQREEEEEEADMDMDRTPWITDSLISPPTGYLQWKTKTREGHGQGADGRLDERSLASARSSRLSSPFGAMDHQSGTSDDGRSVPDDMSSSSATVRGTSTGTGGSTNTKRTRSGTIVPAGAGTSAGAVALPLGARRTRSGTIVGPLPAAGPAAPLPSVPPGGGETGTGNGARVGLGQTRRTRSGTIVATGSGVGGRARSGSVLRSGANTATAATATTKATITEDSGIQLVDATNTTRSRGPVVDGDMDTEPLDEADMDAGAEADIECYVDSLYLPQLTSSPDPIDFLRFASITEEEELEEQLALALPRGSAPAKDMAWFVADEPPSPEVVKTDKDGLKSLNLRGGIFRGKSRGFGIGWRAATKAALHFQRGRDKGKGKKNLKARFEGVEEDEADDEGPNPAEVEDVSDDELLLCPGSTAGLWA